MMLTAIPIISMQMWWKLLIFTVHNFSGTKIKGSSRNPINRLLASPMKNIFQASFIERDAEYTLHYFHVKAVKTRKGVCYIFDLQSRAAGGNIDCLTVPRIKKRRLCILLTHEGFVYYSLFAFVVFFPLCGGYVSFMCPQQHGIAVLPRRPYGEVDPVTCVSRNVYFLKAFSLTNLHSWVLHNSFCNAY